MERGMDKYIGAMTWSRICYLGTREGVECSFAYCCHMKNYLLLLAASAMLFASCGKEEKKTYIIPATLFVAEGPLFDGPNTLQANHVLQLQQIDPAIVADHVKHVRLVKAHFSTTDSVGFDNMRNLVLQLTAANAKMQEVGLLNPVPKGATSVDLQASSEADVHELFRQNEMTMVLDADLVGDREENYELTGELEFEVTYKH